jgi:Rrf2 family protein
MRVSHKADYGVRALTAIAVEEARRPGRPVPCRELAAAEGLPTGFLTTVLTQLAHAGMVRSRRGRDGGWYLTSDPADMTVADVVRVLDGPLASVRDLLPHELPDHGVREPFVSLWIAMRAALRSVLEQVTIADLAAGDLPPEVAAWSADPAAWAPRAGKDASVPALGVGR